MSDDWCYEKPGPTPTLDVEGLIDTGLRLGLDKLPPFGANMSTTAQAGAYARALLHEAEMTPLLQIAWRDASPEVRTEAILIWLRRRTRRSLEDATLIP